LGRTRRRSVSRDVLVIRKSLVSIAKALGRLAPALGAASRGDGSPPTQRRKLRLSPARRSALKLQGRYMGYLRGLKPRQKARVKALRAKKGLSPAIRLAKALAARS
jgi:hypothetical protein